MIKVYQTIVDPGNGNCMQAVIASLLELKLEEVPHFLEYKDGWFKPFWNLLQEKGYQYNGMLHNKNYTSLWHTKKECFEKPKYHYRSIMTPKKLHKEQGVNGLFYAGVLSPNYFSWGERKDATHAVIIDKDYNIVHDPNPAYKNLRQYPIANLLKYNGVVDVMLINPKD